MIYSFRLVPTSYSVYYLTIVYSAMVDSLIDEVSMLMNKSPLNNTAKWRQNLQHMVTEGHFVFKYKNEPFLSEELCVFYFC